MIRLTIGVVLGVSFFLIGLVIIGASVDTFDRKGITEDFWAALIIGGTLFLLGVFITVISFKAHGKRKALARGQLKEAIDSGEAQGVLMGLGMAHVMNSNDYEDDGGDYSD